MKLSVCMIVKNEEEVLKRCLDCVKQFADEIIIVDTGSNDKTKEIAQKYTNKVYDFVWVDDFSSARNFSFSKATSPYVMWLDADDIIDGENIKKINLLKQNLGSQDVVMLKYCMGFDSDNNPTFSYYRERIFKMQKGVLWQGFVHECIAPFGKIERHDIVVVHNKIAPSNPKRNLNLYRKHLKDGAVFNAREQYYFSKEYFYNGYYKTCIKNLKKYLKMNNKFYPNFLDSVLHLAKCYKMLGQYNKALDILLNFIKENPPNSEIICEIAEIYLKQNNLQNAIFFYESALNIEPDYQSGAFIDNNFYYYIPLLQLVYLYYKTENMQKSQLYHKQSLDKYPNDKRVLYNDSFFKKYC